MFCEHAFRVLPCSPGVCPGVSSPERFLQEVAVDSEICVPVEGAGRIPVGSAACACNGGNCQDDDCHEGSHGSKVSDLRQENNGFGDFLDILGQNWYLLVRFSPIVCDDP